MSYSNNIKLPEYKRRRKTIALIKCAVFVCTVSGAIVAQFIYGGRNIAAAAVTLAAAAVIMGALLRMDKLFDKTWDGEIVDKQKQYTKARTLKMILTNHQYPRDKAGAEIPFVRTILTVRRDDGKIMDYAEVGDDESAPLCYYRREEKVRHHAGYKLFEKEDKSRDRAILCINCLSMIPKDEQKCKKCGMSTLR